MQKVQGKMLAEVQGWCRGCIGGAGAVQVVQGGCRGVAGGAGTPQAALQLPAMLLLTRYTYAALLLLIANLPQNLQQELRTGGAAVVARKARRI